MTIITINFADTTSKDSIHDLLITKLNLPNYYGRNLDALYDCLSSKKPDGILKYRLVGLNDMPDELKDYGQRIATVFNRAASEVSGDSTDNIMVVDIV